MTCGFPLLQILDIDELIKPRREAAKKKMLDEIRDETVESAISKITAAKQSQQFEATEEEESELFFNCFVPGLLCSCFCLVNQLILLLKKLEEECCIMIKTKMAACETTVFPAHILFADFIKKKDFY